jgi:hypothetical protein
VVQKSRWCRNARRRLAGRPRGRGQGQPDLLQHVIRPDVLLELGLVQMEARAIDFHNQASVEQEIHITDSRQVDLGAHIETVPPEQYPGHRFQQ